jgi:hypothetical protein
MRIRKISDHRKQPTQLDATKLTAHHQHRGLRLKTTPAAETTLVPHRAPNLTDLLERAKRGKLCDVQQYLSAGGSASVLVAAQTEHAFEAPMLCSVGVLMGVHSQHCC